MIRCVLTEGPVGGLYRSRRFRMRIDETSRLQWYIYKELIEFLNNPEAHTDVDIPDHWYERAADGAALEWPQPSNPFGGLDSYYQRGVEKTRQDLLRCVDLVTDYKKKLETAREEAGDPESLEQVEWKLAVKLNEEVMSSIHSALESNDFETSFEMLVDRKRVFLPDKPWLVVSPPYGNYYITFLNLISDPDMGIERLYKCATCDRPGITTYKRPQRFCSDRCRAQFHNPQKAPQMKEYMRQWRRKNPGMG